MLPLMYYGASTQEHHARLAIQFTIKLNAQIMIDTRVYSHTATSWPKFITEGFTKTM